MPLEPTFPTASGIKLKSIGTIIKERLESTWDQTKTSKIIKATEIYFDSSNQDFPASQAMNRPIVVRVHSQRTLHSDLEIGLATISYISRPTIHVFAYDVNATKYGNVSGLLEDMAQYIRAFIAENMWGFTNEGIHSIVGLEDTWVPNNGDPNWHHWAFQLEVAYEMRRVSP